ncbi:MAG: hypothetical protein V4642_01290 [Bacteroidota bacterium]
MSQRRDIHDYLDGLLESGREAELFKTIGSSEEVRREFNEQFEIHRSARKLAASTTVPAAAREGLFTTLEITSSPEIQLPVPAATNNLRVSFLLSGCIGVILLVLWRLSGVSTFEPDSKVLLQQDVAKTNIHSAGNKPNDQIFFNQKPVQDTILLKKDIVLKASPSKKFILEEASINIEPVSQYNVPTEIQPVSIVQNSFIPRHSVIGPNLGSISFPLLEGIIDAPINVNFRSDATLKSFTTGLLYQVSPVEKFGIEVGYEQFNQEYQLQTAEEAIQVNHTQSIPTFGVTYQRIFPELSPIRSTQAFLQLTTGGTTEGMLVRGIAGVEILPFENVKVQTGIESTIMPYTKQNNWYMAQRTQIIIGLDIKFE